MLEATDLRYRYHPDRPWVVDDVTIAVAPGEVIGLEGPSGCGKTTLGRLLAGYLRPATGTIRVDGGPPPRRGANPVQLVLQHPELAVNGRWRLRDILTEAGPLDPALLEELAIATAWLDRYPHELSGGELQRIAVARALAVSPRYVVADEISAMLDPITQAQLWRVLLTRVRDGDLGVLAISHDAALLGVIADRVVAAGHAPAPVAV
jgi:peptide/nickel transport system ATP-binding protein